MENSFFPALALIPVVIRVQENAEEDLLMKELLVIIS
jgi:hypothetical protein